MTGYRKSESESLLKQLVEKFGSANVIFEEGCLFR